MQTDGNLNQPFIERLGAIMKFREQSRSVKILTVLLTLCVVLGAAFVGVYSLGPATANAHAASLPGTPLDTTGRPSLSLDVSSAAVNVAVYFRLK